MGYRDLESQRETTDKIKDLFKTQHTIVAISMKALETCARFDVSDDDIKTASMVTARNALLDIEELMGET